MQKKLASCKKCGADLLLKRTCRRVYLHCIFCNSIYQLEEFIDIMNPNFDELLADMPCDRI
ncbi:MAG: hypothetical protein HQK76_07365 [Desulfobacterales bacterium]|nr:hypothetical protein [Desulfobacterales bacterium]